MEPKPKERIVFDEDHYYGDEGEKMAINDLMERDGLTEDEVREDFTDDEIFNHQMEMKDFDYEEEMRALAAFFNGEKSDMSDFVNPYGGNHILVSGSVGRWNGTSTGIAVYKDFDAATDCSPSRFGQGNVFADCEIQKVWDENGTLYLAGADDGGYSLSGEAKEAALSRFALPENRKAALDVIRKLNESRDSNENAL